MLLISSMCHITAILSRIDSGDSAAAGELLPLVYDELRKLAAARLSRENPGQTLQATALVHEAFLRLVGEEEQQWNSRGHFFGAAAEAMRRILVDSARKKNALKRGGDRMKVTLEDGDAATNRSEDLIALDDALEQLECHDELAAKLVKLRYFAGLTMSEAANAIGISKRTAERNWTYAKTWLHTRMAEE